MSGPAIVVASEDVPPFDVDARAFEEDTYLVLSAEPEVREPVEHPLQILTDVIECEPHAPGSVIVRQGAPLRLLAVVHDLQCDPTWGEEWIAAALEGILREAESRELHAVALPPLGTRHGSLSAERFVALLRQALDLTPPRRLERIWLAVPAGTEERYEPLLER